MFKSGSILKKAEYFYSLSSELSVIAAISSDGAKAKDLIEKGNKFVQLHSQPGTLLTKEEVIERDKLHKDLGLIYGTMTQEEMQIRTYYSGNNSELSNSLNEIVKLKEDIMDCTRKLYNLK